MDLIVHRLNKNLLDGVPADQDYTSEIIETNGFTVFSIHTYWSGVAITGGNPTIEILCSNSLTAQFVSIKNFGLSVGNNASMINNEKAGFAYLKIVYTKNGATAGTVTSNINAKVF